MTDKLKQCPAEFQALSNAMMALHNSTAVVAVAASEALIAAKNCIPILIKDSHGDFLVADAGETQKRLAMLTAVEFESRAIHALMSNILRKYGYELPVILTRGPGGR
jgi:hypothetical protein